jgi:hypothetical protein
MDDDMPILEKMYMVHIHDDTTPCLQDDEDVMYMEATTTSTPTSHERDYKGMHIGVDDDAMIPLVDMMTCDNLHVMDDDIDIIYAPIIFTFPPIACNMLNTCSFPYITCNDDNDACVVTTLLNKCSFPRFVDNKDKILNMLL